MSQGTMKTIVAPSVENRELHLLFAVIETKKKNLDSRTMVLNAPHFTMKYNTYYGYLPLLDEPCIAPKEVAIGESDHYFDLIKMIMYHNDCI